jgi:hypothetical protein
MMIDPAKRPVNRTKNGMLNRCESTIDWKDSMERGDVTMDVGVDSAARPTARRVHARRLDLTIWLQEQHGTTTGITVDRAEEECPLQNGYHQSKIRVSPVSRSKCMHGVLQDLEDPDGWLWLQSSV